MSAMSDERITSEWDLLKRIRKMVSENGITVPGLMKGIGDDCAVYRLDENRYGLFTTDISIEGTHFLPDRISYHDIAFKAMTGNISDIASMGGRPLMAFISLGLPSEFPEQSVDQIYRGFIESANPFGTVIAGGDISRSKNLVINIALYGEISGREPVLRSGARPGDLILLTGDTGASMAGLDILLSRDSTLAANFPALVKKHIRPVPRVREAMTLLDLNPTSMIDISDGLVSDLRHICDASGTGFILRENKLPLRNDLRKYTDRIDIDPSRMVLESGEEYELICTVNPSATIPERIGDVPVTVIGEITTGRFTLSTMAGEREISPDGWDHFK